MSWLSPEMVLKSTKSVRDEGDHGGKDLWNMEKVSWERRGVMDGDISGDEGNDELVLSKMRW